MRPVQCFEFKETPDLSVHSLSIAVGAFTVFEKDFKVPLRIIARQSAQGHAAT